MTGLDPDLAELIARMKALDPDGAADGGGDRRAPALDPRQSPDAGCCGGSRRCLIAVLFLGGVKYTFDLRAERRLAVEARQEAEEVSEFLVGLFADSRIPSQSRGGDDHRRPSSSPAAPTASTSSTASR